MGWLLAISVVFNILFVLVIAALVYAKITADNEAFHYHEQWSKWEGLFYEIQGKLIEDYNLFVGPTMGEYGKLLIKKHRGDSQ